MQAHRALLELRRGEDPVHRLSRVDSTRIHGVHLHQVSQLKVACSSGKVLFQHAIVLYHELPDRRSHPAILVLMVMNGASLPDLPADGHQLKKRCLVDEISGVMLAVPDEVPFNGLRINGMIVEDLADEGNVREIALITTSQFGG